MGKEDGRQGQTQRNSLVNNNTQQDGREQRREKRKRIVKKQPRNPKIRLVKYIISAALLIVIVGQAYAFLQVMQEKRHVEQQLQELQKKNDELQLEKNQLQNPNYIQGVARNELGLVKPGEVPYVK